MIFSLDHIGRFEVRKSAALIKKSLNGIPKRDVLVSPAYPLASENRRRGSWVLLLLLGLLPGRPSLRGIWRELLSWFRVIAAGLAKNPVADLVVIGFYF